MTRGVWTCGKCSAAPFATHQALANHERWTHSASRRSTLQQAHVATHNGAGAGAPPALGGWEDDDNGGGQGVEPAAAMGAQAPQTQAALAPNADDELKALFTEWRCNCNGGAGASDADVRHLLRMINLRPHCESFFESITDSDAFLSQLREKHPDACWRKIEVPIQMDVPGCEALPALPVYVRDLKAVMEHLVKTLPIKWGFWPPDTVNGKRVYDHPCSGLLFQHLQKLVAECNADAVPCIIWSDKVQPFKAGSFSYYPASLIVASVVQDEMRQQWPKNHIAFLPVLDNNDPMFAHLRPETFRSCKAAAHTAIMEAVLFPCFDASTRYSCKDAAGTNRIVAPVFLFYVADYQEAEAANAMLSDTLSLVCHAPHNSSKLRTRGDLMEALGEMQTAAATRPDRLPPPKLKTQSRLRGVESIMMKLMRRSWLSMLPQELLDTCPWLQCPAFYTPPDVLHVMDEGILKYFFQCCVFAHLKRVTQSKGQATFLLESVELRHIIMQRESFIEKLAHPRANKLWNATRQGTVPPCGGLQGNEMRAAIQFAPHLLHGLVGQCGSDGQWHSVPRSADYLEQMGVKLHELYAASKRYNHAHGHTSESLDELCAIQLQCHELLRNDATFLEDQSSGWLFPKAWLAFLSAEQPHHFSKRWIQWLGSPRFTSSEWGENSVKVLNAAARASNRNRDTLVPQICTDHANKAVAERHLTQLGLTAAPPRLGTAQTARVRAVKTNEACFPERAKKVNMHCLCGGVASHLPFLKHREGLAHLPMLLAEHLEVDLISRTDTVEIVNYAVIIGRPFHLQHTEYFAHQVIYAAPMHRGKKRFSWLAVVGTKPGDEWYGQVQLLFRYKDKKYALLRYVVPVKEKRFLGGALLDKPGCGLFQWEGIFGIVDVDAERVLRREVFIPDLSDVYSRATAPKPRRKHDGGDAAGTGAGSASAIKSKTVKPKRLIKCRRKRAMYTDDDESDQSDSEDQPDSDYDCALQKKAKPKRKRTAKQERAYEEDDDEEESGASDEGGPRARSAKGKQQRKRQRFDVDIKRWIRTQLVWGFDGGLPSHEQTEVSA